MLLPLVKPEHVSPIQILVHISFMALQLWVRCFFSHCHISVNVILHACTHTLIHHIQILVNTHEHIHTHTTGHIKTHTHAHTMSAGIGTKQQQPPHTYTDVVWQLAQTHTLQNAVHKAALLVSSPTAILSNEWRRSDACSWAIMSITVAWPDNLPTVRL